MRKTWLVAAATTWLLVAGCTPADSTDSDKNDGASVPVGAVAQPDRPEEGPRTESSAISALLSYEGGTVFSGSIPSAYVEDRVPYHLWLPYGYTSLETPLPLLVMLHGLGPGLDADHWLNLGLDRRLSVGIAEGRYPPVALVLPEGNAVAYIKDAAPIPQIIVKELVPYLEETLPVGGTPGLRAIGGVSRGGYWAVATALLYPRFFSRVGSHSGYFYPNTEAPHLNPSALLPEAGGLAETAFYFDVAEDDPTAWRTVDFVAALRRRTAAIREQAATGDTADPSFGALGSGVFFDPAPTGGHSDEYWADRIPDYLEFYTESWPP